MNEMYMKYHLISENDWTIENLYCPTYLQSMTNNVKVALSVGDATRVVYNYYWARQIGDTRTNPYGW
jgi:hypothetical protein